MCNCAVVKQRPLFSSRIMPRAKAPACASSFASTSALCFSNSPKIVTIFSMSWKPVYVISRIYVRVVLEQNLRNVDISTWYDIVGKVVGFLDGVNVSTMVK